MGADEVLRGMLKYFVLPLWLADGFADYLCHRAAHIGKTNGWQESAVPGGTDPRFALPRTASEGPVRCVS
jgi:hypothetical protein